MNCILFDSKSLDRVSRVSTQNGMRSPFRFIAGLVHPAIGATANETYNIVVVVDSPLASISHRRHLGICRL